MVRYIDMHRDEFGVEPICSALQVAPSTYYAAKSRLPSERSCRDALMVPILVALFVANYRVYGAHKLWKAARRATDTAIASTESLTAALSDRDELDTSTRTGPTFTDTTTNEAIGIQ